MVSIDKCKKSGVVFEELISSCEVVNCTSIQVQATSSVPTMAVEKTDGCQIYLPLKTAQVGGWVGPGDGQG
jgi:adenylyl cyclase-associated protein